MTISEETLRAAEIQPIDRIAAHVQRSLRERFGDQFPDLKVQAMWLDVGAQIGFAVKSGDRRHAERFAIADEATSRLASWVTSQWTPDSNILSTSQRDNETI